MRIGRNKVLAAFGAVVVVVAAIVAWLVGGRTGLLVVVVALTTLSTAALGGLVAMSERRIRRLMTEHHRRETRLSEAIEKMTTNLRDGIAASGHTGKQSEQLLAAVQSAFARQELETRRAADELSSSVLESIERGFRSVDRELASATRELGTLVSGVDVSRREASVTGRRLDETTQRLEATIGEVETLAATSRTAFDDLRASVLEELTRRSRNEVVTNFRRLVDEAVSEFDSLQRLTERFPVTEKPPPLGGWAIGPGALLYLLEHVEARGSSLVVECGPGASTIYLAEFFRRRGHGRVVSLEHDERFFNYVTDDLARRGLSEFAEVRHAPLIDVEVGGGTQPWYDPSVLAEIAEIDVLLVDGPPQATGKLARYPAVPLLGGRLGETALVIVDDAHRPGEQAAMARWRDELGWESLITPPGGFAALTRPIQPETADGDDAASADGDAASDHESSESGDPATDPA